MLVVFFLLVPVENQKTVLQRQRKRLRKKVSAGKAETNPERNSFKMKKTRLSRSFNKTPNEEVSTYLETRKISVYLSSSSSVFDEVFSLCFYYFR